MNIALTTLLSMGGRTSAGTAGKMGHGTDFQRYLDGMSSARGEPATSKAPGNGSGFGARSMLGTDMLKLATLPAPSPDPVLSADADVADAPASEDAEASASGSNGAGVIDANGFDAKMAALSALPARAAALVPEMDTPGNTAG